MNQLGLMVLVIVLAILSSCSYEHNPYIEGDLHQEHEVLENSTDRR